MEIYLKGNCPMKINNNIQASVISPLAGKNLKKAKPETDAKQSLAAGDTFKPSKRESNYPIKSMVKNMIVGSAIGAGVMTLSGGSVLAAFGLSVAAGAGLGALRGAAAAFGASLTDFNNDRRAMSKDPALGALLFGGIGLAKGIARGAVLGALTAAGFGAVGGAVGCAALPVAWTAYNRVRENHIRKTGGGLRD